VKREGRSARGRRTGAARDHDRSRRVGPHTWGWRDDPGGPRAAVDPPVRAAGCEPAHVSRRPARGVDRPGPPGWGPGVSVASAAHRL